MHSAPRKVVLIGASTGGPSQIEKIIKSLPKLENTSFVIAQHMADGFMPSFAIRLQDRHHNTIKVVLDDEYLESAHIYLCTGLTYVEKKNYELKFIFNPPVSNSYNPDINVMFRSFLPLVKEMEVLSVILTGIGEDGVSAMTQLSVSGVRCITEDAQSAIVDGMPSRARLLVPNIEVHSLDKIIEIIDEFCK
jgi:two-component system chemotaxis response regulator CheB